MLCNPLRQDFLWDKTLMDTFVWDQFFTTGLPEVDEQHRALVDAFNDLSAALQRSNTGDDAGLTDVYERMVNFAEFHFAEEELLMHNRGVDPRHVQAHTALHRQFIEQVAGMWRSREALQDPAQSFVGFLTSWLGLHILGIDQSLARQLAGLEMGLSAQEAYEQEMQVHDRGTQALIQMVGRLYQVLSQQNTELAQSNLHLEERVQLRTQELARANEELQRANARLEVYARTDGLMQIANRACFDDRLAQACASAFRQERPLGVLMIDVDHFKRYNDTYGHPAGDACLQAVARAVAQALPRVTDLLARYGGEELAVILPDTDAEGSRTVARRVVEAVAALGLPHSSSGVAPHVTVSVGGVARVPGSKDAATRLLAEADAALYRAKEGGRNGWQMASP